MLRIEAEPEYLFNSKFASFGIALNKISLSDNALRKFFCTKTLSVSGKQAEKLKANMRSNKVLMIFLIIIAEITYKTDDYEHSGYYY